MGLRVKKLRLELNSAGFQQILTSSQVMGLVSSHTTRIAAAAGAGFESEVMVATRHGSPRATGMVWAASQEAREAEANNKALTSAIGG